MAATKANTNPMQEMVEVFLPYVSGEDPMAYAGLNGKAWNIPRGSTQLVPKPVADILRESEKAKRKELEYIEKQQRLMRESMNNPIQ